jgi:hypothetical protein
MCEFHERDDVDLNHLDFTCKVAFSKRSAATEARIVHQKLDLDVSLREFVADPLCGSRLSKILREDVYFDWVLDFDLFGKRYELVVSPRHNDYVAPFGRKQPGELRAQS